MNTTRKIISIKICIDNKKHPSNQGILFSLTDIKKTTTHEKLNFYINKNDNIHKNEVQDIRRSDEY